MNIAELIKNGKFAVTAEAVPPADDDDIPPIVMALFIDGNSST
mgnify:CR=1 FL=1